MMNLLYNTFVSTLLLIAASVVGGTNVPWRDISRRQLEDEQCKFPINFTYYQRASGFYCQEPNHYLGNIYGGNFSVDSEGAIRGSTNPLVGFTVVDVATNWDGLIGRLAELDPGVARGGGPHTPSLFWDGRKDVFWHANATEDTISTQFKESVDEYITGCLKQEDVASITLSPPPTPANQTNNSHLAGDGCSLDHNGSTSGNDGLVPFNDTMGNTTLGDDDSSPCFVFFYSSGCPHCAVVKEYIDEDLANADVAFHYEAYDVRTSDYSQRLILGYQHFGWSGEQAVPTIFIGNEGNMSVLVGEAAILDKLMRRIHKLPSNSTPCYNFAMLVENPDFVIADSDNLNWGVLTAAAFVDSINPCAIAVLLILLGGLTLSVVPSVPVTEDPGTGEGDPESSTTPRAPKDEQPAIVVETKKEEAEEMNGDDVSVPNEQETRMLDEERVECSRDEEEEVAEPDTTPATATGTDAPDSTTSASSGSHHHDDAAAAAAAAAVNSTTNEQQQQVSHQGQHLHRRAFLSGMAFILAVFIAYYALGFGIFTAVSSTQVTSTILLVLGVIVILLGIWNVKDFFCYEKGANVEIPRSWRPMLKRILGAVTSPIGAFAAGFIVCLFELPCTGGPYLFILGLLADQNTRTEAAFMLLYYNFIFVLPLIVINCLVFWGVSTLEKVGSWKEKYIRHLHLVAGLVLISLGVLAVVNTQIPLF